MDKEFFRAIARTACFIATAGLARLDGSEPEWLASVLSCAIGVACAIGWKD